MDGYYDKKYYKKYYKNQGSLIFPGLCNRFENAKPSPIIDRVLQKEGYWD
ncbi:MAG: hypothetical protein A4E55_01780 [Pelotomaculum sp. PtaU1.Bin035]|nr:MAG: hypothetical protein A4E55_01780 [Pelotomaculum sp. PtaU1.Bin035]